MHRFASALLGLWGLSLIVCLVLFGGCGDQPQSATVGAPEELKTFRVEYIRQGSYNAFPGGSGIYGAQWVGEQFEPCSSWVEFYETKSGLADTALVNDPDLLFNYVEAHMQRYENGQRQYPYRLIAIKALRDPVTFEIRKDYGGATPTGTYNSAFVCVGMYLEEWEDQAPEAIGFTVVHELGHAIATLTHPCLDYFEHSTNRLVPCFMEYPGLHLYEGDPFDVIICRCPMSGTYCWETNDIPEFCDSCKTKIKRTTAWD